MFTYEVKSGNLLHNGTFLVKGYSGQGPGLNNVEEEAVHNVGPVPRGKYKIGEFFNDPGGKGPLVAHLLPLPGTNDFGRSGFMIHGDNRFGNESASHGCIIISHPYRKRVSDSKDRDLEVV